MERAAAVEPCPLCLAEGTIDVSAGMCRHRRKARRRRIFWIVNAVVNVVLVVLVVASLQRRGVPASRAIGMVALSLLLMLALFAAILVVSIVIHEAGHALAARLLGFRIAVIRLGVGKRLRTFRVGGVTLELFRIPFGGEVISFTSSKRLFRLRLFLHVLAGLLATGLLAFMAWRWQTAERTITDLARDAVVFLNVLLLVTNLFPYKTTVHHQGRQEPRMSDGMYLVTIPRMSSQRIDEIFGGYRLVEALVHYDRGEYARALELIDAAAAGGAPEAAVKQMRAGALLGMGRVDEARALLVQALDVEGLDEDIRAVVQNDLAWASVLAGDPTLMAEADVLSAAALARMPLEPAVAGTRGSVLIELGRLEEGLALLGRAVRNQRRPHDRALNYAMCAIAEARRGDIAMAEHAVRAARAADPGCVLLARAEDEVARARAGAPA